MLNIGLGLAKDIASIARRAGAEIMKIDAKIEEYICIGR